MKQDYGDAGNGLKPGHAYMSRGKEVATAKESIKPQGAPSGPKGTGMKGKAC